MTLAYVFLMKVLATFRVRIASVGYTHRGLLQMCIARHNSATDMSNCQSHWHALTAIGVGQALSVELMPRREVRC